MTDPTANEKPPANKSLLVPACAGIATILALVIYSSMHDGSEQASPAGTPVASTTDDADKSSMKAFQELVISGKSEDAIAWMTSNRDLLDKEVGFTSVANIWPPNKLLQPSSGT